MSRLRMWQGNEVRHDRHDARLAADLCRNERYVASAPRLALRQGAAAARHSCCRDPAPILAGSLLRDKPPPGGGSTGSTPVAEGISRPPKDACRGARSMQERDSSRRLRCLPGSGPRVVFHPCEDPQPARASHQCGNSDSRVLASRLPLASRVALPRTANARGTRFGTRLSWHNVMQEQVAEYSAVGYNPMRCIRTTHPAVRGWDRVSRSLGKVSKSNETMRVW